MAGPGSSHRTISVTGAVLGTCALLGACAALDDGVWDELQRPPLDITLDVVDPTPDRIVGHWACHELDPFPDQAPVLTDLRLDPDGTFEWQQRILLDGETPGPFELVLILEGNWHLDAALLVRDSVTGTSQPADGSEPAGPRPLMDGILAAFAKEAETVPTELLRVSADELVMRDAEAGVATLGCRRLAP